MQIDIYIKLTVENWKKKIYFNETIHIVHNWFPFMIKKKL